MTIMNVENVILLLAGVGGLSGLAALANTLYNISKSRQDNHRSAQQMGERRFVSTPTILNLCSVYRTIRHIFLEGHTTWAERDF
jgi:hypothetical protein